MVLVAATAPMRTAINSKGQIAGTGSHNGLDHAFLLTKIAAPTLKPPKVFVNGSTHIVTKFKRESFAGTSNGDVASIRYKLNGNAYRRAHGPVSGWKFSIRPKLHKNVVRVIAVSSVGKKSAPLKIVIIRKA